MIFMRHIKKFESFSTGMIPVSGDDHNQPVNETIERWLMEICPVDTYNITTPQKKVPYKGVQIFSQAAVLREIIKNIKDEETLNDLSILLTQLMCQDTSLINQDMDFWHKTSYIYSPERLRGLYGKLCGKMGNNLGNFKAFMSPFSEYLGILVEPTELGLPPMGNKEFKKFGLEPRASYEMSEKGSEKNPTATKESYRLKR